MSCQQCTIGIDSISISGWILIALKCVFIPELWPWPFNYLLKIIYSRILQHGAYLIILSPQMCFYTPQRCRDKNQRLIFPVMSGAYFYRLVCLWFSRDWMFYFFSSFIISTIFFVTHWLWVYARLCVHKENAPTSNMSDSIHRLALHLRKCTVFLFVCFFK